MAILLYILLTPALYYLGCQAEITHPIWSRYPEWFDRFMQCPACTGFWWGVACAGLGRWQGWDFLTVPSDSWLAFPLVGLASICWTPIMSRKMTDAMIYDTERAPTSDYDPDPH